MHNHLWWMDKAGPSFIFGVTCPRGTMFVKAVDATLEVKDAIPFFWLAQMIVFFCDGGRRGVVQVLTDNAANYFLMLQQARN